VSEPKIVETLSRSSLRDGQPKTPDIFTLEAMQDFSDEYLKYGVTQTGEAKKMLWQHWNYFQK